MMVSCGSAGSRSLALCLPHLSPAALLVSERPMPAPAPQSCTFNVGIRVGQRGLQRPRRQLFQSLLPPLLPSPGSAGAFVSL